MSNQITAMEIIKINKNAIKLILAPEESEKYEFITDSNATDEVMLSSLNLLLQSVREKSCIDLLGKRLLVQVYYDKIGECEIYIASTEGDEMYKDRTAPIGTRKAIGYKSIYRFDSLDDILIACSRLNGVADENNSQIYYDEQREKYYLACQNISARELRYSFLSEYSKQLKPQVYFYIREHLKCLCDSNAINIFSNLV
ncbi:MAG: adaptor protein MecA [Clostridia bacterium]|nr:adaptor protein MecA [Clostridia bacterium]